MTKKNTTTKPKFDFLTRTDSPTPEPKGQIAPEPEAGRKGKRSDPDYRQTTMLIKRATLKAAQRKIADLDNGEDLSDVINRLVDAWSKEPITSSPPKA